MRALLALTLFALVACSSDAKKKAEPPKDDVTDGPVVSKIGAECTSDVPFDRGTCSDGQACLPAPGGYCSQPCSFDECPGASVCASGPRAGDICMAPCESESDCRPGFQCDKGWGVCTLPGVVGPKPPSCPHIAAPPRMTWSKPVQISTSKGPGRYHFEPAAGLTKDGAIAALYITNGVRTTATKSPFPNVLASSLVLADGTVRGDKSFSSPSENHFDPWVARDRDGLIHAVWLGFDGGKAPEKNMKIGYSTTRDGESWSTAKTAHRSEDCPEGTDGCMDKPMIAIGRRHDSRRKDAIYVFYFSNPQGGLVVTRSIDGGETFEASVKISEAAYADAEVDSKGILHVVYSQSPPGQFSSLEGRIKYRYSSDGGKSFSEEITVSDETEAIPFFFSNPQVVPDPKRKRVSVVYPTGDASGRWSITFATTGDQGKTWSRVKANDDESCANHMTPAAVLDAKTGAIHAAWAENRAGAGRIVSTVCDAEAVACSANDQVSEQEFAAYSFARHSPKWLGEYFSLVPDAERNKLHAVWTQPVNEDGQPISRIFWASRPLEVSAPTEPEDED